MCRERCVVGRKTEAMRIKLCCWLLAVCTSLFWTVLTLIFLRKIYSQAFFLQVHQNMHIKDLSSYEFAIFREVNFSHAGKTDENIQNLYQLMKAAWPPKARPGDDGYGGAGVTINRSLLTEREKVIYDNGLKNWGVNHLASEKVALRRDIILDMPECKNLTYDTSNLPTVGIVIIFTEEMWSALFRAVFSILDAGPEELITEIVLVDDASQKDTLGLPLDNYIRIFGGKVKLVRLPERKGLMVARNTGFQHVTGEVVVFLDGHCEVSKGWLEPLLQRIKEDDSVVAIPQSDVLKWDTFEYKFTKNNDQQMCGFDFDMLFTWIPIPPPDGIKRRTWADPIPTPTHLGCCLATSKKNFDKLGRYDPGLEIWGCENLELSFKTWMCGGRLEIIPCSHIAHMFKHHIIYKWVGKPLILERNCLRVSEVWMDEYKVFYQHRLKAVLSEIDFGDVSEMKALREKLKCRSFDWYVKTISPDVYIPFNTTAAGNISNVRYPTQCVDKDFSKRFPQPIAFWCNQQNNNQYFYLSKEKQIRRDSNCLSYNNQTRQFVSRQCKDNPGAWTYSQDNLIMLEGTGLCMTMVNQTKIDMAACNSSDTSQQ